jgi:hypothetical protein
MIRADQLVEELFEQAQVADQHAKELEGQQ